MYIRNLILIILISTVSCSQKSNNEIIQSDEKLDSILNTLPYKVQHVFFISPISKCLYCDRSLFILSQKDNVRIITTFEKKKVFEKDVLSDNIIILSEEEYNHLFQEKYWHLDKYIKVINNRIVWIQNITPQYIDTLISKIK